MSIGDGIAILGFWGFAGAASLSGNVTASGWWLAMAIASAFTIIVMVAS